MQLVTYFGFTLVSVLIQFCVMDFINENIEVDKRIENVSRVHPKQDVQAIISKISEKPHGLYYQTDKKVLPKGKSPFTLYNNDSLPELTTTELSSTIIDWVFDENVSTTEDSLHSTDMYTTEFENVTEITLFDRKNTTMTPNTRPKKTEDKCNCNILYETCDINCCCDSDCSDSERNLFDCENKKCQDWDTENIIHMCPSDKCLNKMTTNFLENLFCISKTNLPNKRLTDIQFDEAAINRSPKWHKHNRQETVYELKKNIYIYKEPIWLLNNGSILYAEIPVSVTNNYCSGKKPVKFLINEDVKCIVKLQDLHMFQVLKNVEGGSVLSPVISFPNITAKNMTTFHHTNWTLYICDALECITYNKSRHEPFCTDNYCNNIATMIHYKFYYFESKIIKAEIKFHIQKVLMHLQFITQNVKVKFYLSNKPVEGIIKLSGNLGYSVGLPIITSTAENNHTMHFFNNTSGIKNILTYPENINGDCILSNISYKIVQFGQNKRSKCRINIRQDINLSNATRACQNIQNQIFRYLGLDSIIYVSPYGNPQHIKDEYWLQIQMFDKYYVYGILDKKSSVLQCSNLVTRIAYVIAYADINSEISKEQNKILHVNVQGTAQNITFYADDISSILTIDTNFIDISKPDVFEYASAPHLKIYLPKSFFLPSNTGDYLHDNMKYLKLILFLLCPCII